MKKFVSLLVLCMMAGLKADAHKGIPRIGIIGGGIGGTSCAYFLKSLFNKKEVTIDLFEADHVGGRLALANFSGHLYEEGGSIIHSRNKYMLKFLHDFKLQRRESPGGYFALYNGHDFVFTESEWKLKTLWSVIYRYGFGFWKLRTYIEGMLNKFDRIYKLQSMKKTYNTVGSLLADVDPKFVDYLHMTTKFGFENEGISHLVIHEIVMAAIRANYGQNLNIQKMVGSVSVAGAIGNLWSVDGGNVKIPKKLLKASRANLIHQRVTSVERLLTGKMKINAKPTLKSPQRNEQDQIYDVVILAAPQTPDSKFKIDFLNFDEKINFPGRYHETVCTLVEGTLSEDYFSGKNPIIDEVLTTSDDIWFNSVGRIHPVDYKTKKYKESNVWKVFTKKEMEESQIHSLFSEVKNVRVRKWLAYPHYETLFRNDSFVLSSNLYHINAIEWAASAMEMSAIGAKNVALLAYNSLMSKDIQALSPNEPLLVEKEEL